MKNESKVCPRCGQGIVVKARVKKTSKEIYICNECDAVWFCSDSIDYATFNYFNIYMERQGLDDKWDELEVDQ